MPVYSPAGQGDVEMGSFAEPLSWIKFRNLKKPKEKYRTLQQFLKGDSDPIAVIVSGSPSVVVSAWDGLIMTKKGSYDPSDLAAIFLAKGYRVLYIYQSNDPTPFSTELHNLFSKDEGGLLGKLSAPQGSIQVVAGDTRVLISHALTAQKEAVERNYLLHMRCDHIEEYMLVIYWANHLIKGAGAHVLWLFAWEVPSHYFVTEPSVRSDHDEDDANDTISHSTFSSDIHLPFTSARVVPLPELLLSFRRDCGASGLLVSLAVGPSETDALERAREFMAHQDVDVVLGVCMDSIKRTYVLLDRCDESSVLRLAVSARKTRANVESSVVTALLSRHRDISGRTVPVPSPSVVSELATKYTERSFPAEATAEGTIVTPRGGPAGRQQSAGVRVGTVIRTMTTMAGNDELIGHRACALLCVISVVFVVGFFALVTYLMRDV